MALRMIFLLGLAALSPFLLERAKFAIKAFGQKPGDMTYVNSFHHYKVVGSDIFRDCEDAAMDEKEGVVIAACDPDRDWHNTVMGVSVPHEMQGAGIYLYDYKKNVPEAEQIRRFRLIDFIAKTDLHTLGVEYDSTTKRLYVASHAEAGPRIEIFELDFEAMTATHLGTVEHPLLHGPNSIALIGPNELYVTNDHHFRIEDSALAAKLETYLALPLGTVVYVKLGERGVVDEAKVVARLPFANGVVVVNATTVAVASTTRGTVTLFQRAKHRTAALQPGATFHVPFLPDNLSLTRSGALMITGHGYPPALEKYARTRHVCNDAARLAAADAHMKEYCRAGKTVSGVAEWREGKGLRLLYYDDEFPTSTTAMKDEKRGVGVVAGLYAHGLFVWWD